MGIRQVRITDTTQLKARSPEWMGKRVHVILRDNTAMLGTLLQVNDHHIVLRNMRQKKMSYPLSAISELYFDAIA